MGAYSMEELVRRWQTGELLTEQAIGQILLLLKELDARLAKLERQPSPPKKRKAQQGKNSTQP